MSRLSLALDTCTFAAPIRSPRSHRATIYRVFVNGRSRPVIMDDMKERIERGDIRMERAAAIKVGLLGCCDKVPY